MRRIVDYSRLSKFYKIKYQKLITWLIFFKMKSKRRRKMKNCIKKIKKCMKKSKKGMRLKSRIQNNKYNIYKIQYHKRIQKMITLNKL